MEDYLLSKQEKHRLEDAEYAERAGRHSEANDRRSQIAHGGSEHIQKALDETDYQGYDN